MNWHHLEILFATNRAYEKLAQLADGMKEIRKIDFLKKLFIWVIKVF